MSVAKLPCDSTTSLASSFSVLAMLGVPLVSTCTGLLPILPYAHLWTQNALTLVLFPASCLSNAQVSMAPRLPGTSVPTLLLLKGCVSSTPCGLYFFAWCFQERVSLVYLLLQMAGPWPPEAVVSCCWSF